MQESKVYFCAVDWFSHPHNMSATHVGTRRSIHNKPEERGAIMPLILLSIQLCLPWSMDASLLSLIDAETLHNTCERDGSWYPRAPPPDPHLAMIAGAAVILFGWLWISYFGPEVAAVDDVIRSMIISPKALWFILIWPRSRTVAAAAAGQITARLQRRDTITDYVCFKKRRKIEFSLWVCAAHLVWVHSLLCEQFGDELNLLTFTHLFGVFAYC